MVQISDEEPRRGYRGVEPQCCAFRGGNLISTAFLGLVTNEQSGTSSFIVHPTSLINNNGHPGLDRSSDANGHPFD